MSDLYAMRRANGDWFALDEGALDDLGNAGGALDVYFWLVDTPFTNLKRGQKVDHAQIAALVQVSQRGGRV